MGGINIFVVCLLSAGLLLACSCDSNDVAIPDSVLARAHIQSAIIPPVVTAGSTLRIPVRVVEGCRLGDWEGVSIRFDAGVFTLRPG